MRFRYGMIHGRFQPFHLEHLRYFRVAWERSDNVLIGITNPDPSTIIEDPLSEHRHLPEDNPFTFTERLIMIQNCLREEGFPMDRIYIVPLPIHHPERWHCYIPPTTTMFIVAYSPWERRKAERLREAGYEVVVIDSLEKGISGRQVRDLLSCGGDWEPLVPSATARFLKRKQDAGI